MPDQQVESVLAERGQPAPLSPLPSVSIQTSPAYRVPLTAHQLQRSENDLTDMLLPKWLQDIDLNSGEQLRRQLKARILRRGPDEGDHPLLHPRQKGVLLGLVEAVDLVTEEDRPPALQPLPLLGLGNDLPNPGHPRGHGAERLEMPIGVGRNQVGESGLAGAGRAPEYDAGDITALDGLPQRLPFPNEVILAKEVVQTLRPHSVCEGPASSQPFK